MKRILALAVLLLAAAAARAAVVTIVAQGTVLSVDDPNGLLQFPAPPQGTAAEFSLSIDTATQDLRPADPGFGIYIGAGPAQLALGVIAIGPDDFNNNSGAVVILNDVTTAPGSATDQWSATSTGPCLDPPPAACRHVFISVSLRGPGTLLASDALVVPGWPSAGVQGEINYSIGEETSPGRFTDLAKVRAGLNSLTVSEVPLPSAVWLFPAALGACLARARRRPWIS